MALLGPRQAGKTTLARSLGGNYFDLETERDRLRLDVEWDPRVLGKQLLVLDEAQANPEIFPRLRAAIDEDRARTGRFLLLGSVSPQLMRQVSESLAGRLALVELTPFLLGELETDAQRNRLWEVGGYPEGGILRPSSYGKWQRDYLDLLAQRDLPSWGLSARPQTTQRLMRMLAAVHGQLWNASAIARSLGVDFKTVNRYVEFLEGAYLVRRLMPYHANLKKRLVKSPRLYWRDSGLLHALLRVEQPKQLLDQPWVGSSWEGFVIEQLLGHLEALGATPEPYFLRTSDGYEIDLLVEMGGKRWAIEIKLTSHPSPQDMARLDKVADWADVDLRVLISRTSDVVESDDRISCSLSAFLERAKKRLP